MLVPRERVKRVKSVRSLKIEFKAGKEILSAKIQIMREIERE